MIPPASVLLPALAGIALTLPIAGAAYQLIATRRDERKYPPPGKLVNVGGQRLHVQCSGDELQHRSPTVVFDAGWGDFSLAWGLVQPEVSKFARACSYDRAGLGWSDAGTGPRTSRRIAEELRLLLRGAGLEAPYVLVGHSFGATNVMVYAGTYPEDVAGLVLVDPAHEDQPVRYGKRARRHSPVMKFGLLSAPFGLPRLFLPLYATYHPAFAKVRKFSGPYLSAYRAVLSGTKHLRTSYDELMNIWESLEQARAAARPLGNMPLRVITAPQMNAADDRVWRELHGELAGRSSDGRQIIVEGSGHYPHYDHPDSVIEAVREVVEASRQSLEIRG